MPQVFLKWEVCSKQFKAQWERNLAVNFMGPALLSQWVAKQMLPRHARRNCERIASNAALVPRMNMGLYATTKATVSHFFKNLALELAPHGIRCNLVLPSSDPHPNAKTTLDR